MRERLGERVSRAAPLTRLDGLRGEGGSALMLMPAAVLVMIVLGAFAVDATVAFLAQREVANLSAGIANDIAGAAIDDAVFYGEGRVQLDPVRAQRVVDLSLSTSTPEYLGGLAVEELSFPSPDQVTVRVSASADYLFSAALPGVPEQIRVTATASAVARQD